MTTPGTRGTAAARFATRNRTVTRARAGPRVTAALERRAALVSERRADFLTGLAVAFRETLALAAVFARDLPAAALAAGFLPATFLATAFLAIFLTGFFRLFFAAAFVFLRL